MAETAMTFQDLGLSEAMRKALEKKGYGYPTSVNGRPFLPLLAWKDVIAKAPTGTGKTFAFGIPMIEHVNPESSDVQGLILAPTRELAIQICDELRSLLRFIPASGSRCSTAAHPWSPRPRPWRRSPRLWWLRRAG